MVVAASSEVEPCLLGSFRECASDCSFEMPQMTARGAGRRYSPIIQAYYCVWDAEPTWFPEMDILSADAPARNTEYCSQARTNVEVSRWFLCRESDWSARKKPR
jgi:hypothetical protein